MHFYEYHNVHVNRAPLSGIVTHIDYKPGGYIPAFNKDSDVNERNHVVFDTASGTLELTTNRRCPDQKDRFLYQRRNTCQKG